MSNEFVIKNGFHSRGNSEITGSLTVTAGITGSLAGTSTSSSYAETASYVPTGVGGLYSGDGTIPTSTVATITDTISFVSGNVGIGTTTPEYTLDVIGPAGTTNFEDVVRVGVSDTADSFVITNGVSTNGTFAPVLRSYQTSSTQPFFIQGTIATAVDTGTNSVIRIQARASGSGWEDVTTRPVVQFLNNSTKLMTIDATGNVGIGTETPANPLHVYSSGSTYVSKIENSVSATRIRFQGSSTTNEPWIGSGANSFQIGHVTGGETLTVTDEGNVGIGTAVPGETLTVLGSFNLREYGAITAPTSSADWYRIGYTSGDDRGGIRVLISYTGGNWVPQTYVINAYKNYTTAATLQLEKYGTGAYIREARIVEDEIDSTTYHLEVYLASYAGDGVKGHSARIYFDKNLGYEGSWNLNTGSLSASTSVANPVARSPFPLSVDGHTFPSVLLNDNINDNFWKLEDGDGTLNFTDWDSDNLIQLDGVNNQVNISHSLQVLGGITGSLLGTASYADNVLFEPGQLGTNSTVRIDSFNTASGNYSFAVGTDNNASGVVAMTLGSGNTASGDRAVALGRENIASGSRSFVSGYLNISSHNQTFAHGYLNTASQQYAVAIGRENTSAGIGSVALGYLNYLATGSYSFAAGYNNNIVPSYAGAIGYNNTILSTYGMAFGALNQAGNYAVAAGYNNDATAIYSVALGGSNLASGNGSVALGTTNKSLGSRSIALGYLVTASADHSVAIGREVSANALYSSVVGGRLNNADAVYSGIFAGVNNNVPAAGFSGSVIIGGDSNVNSGSYSAIVGGRNNTIGPGVNNVILGGTNIDSADNSNTVFVPNFYATGSVQAPNIANTETSQIIYYNTSSGMFTYGAIPTPTVVPDATKVFNWFMNAT